MYHRFQWTRSSRRRNGISKEYEPFQPYFLLALINATGCRTFADVGSNIGAYSILMSQASSVEKVVAFEANSAVVQEVQTNFQLNSLTAEIRPVAVSNQKGTLQFGIVSRLAGNSAAVETASRENYHKVEQVDCVTLDEALADCPSPLAIKIDVEGHEKQVLAGARDILDNPCVIQVENYAGDLDLPDSFTKMATIGPDWYYSNIAGIDAISLFEQASAMMIKSNHETKSASIHLGDFALTVSGRSYEIFKRVAKKCIGSRL